MEGERKESVWKRALIVIDGYVPYMLALPWKRLNAPLYSFGMRLVTSVADGTSRTDIVVKATVDETRSAFLAIT